MGLYLCVFDGEEELEGIEVGHYSDFGAFRDAIRVVLEAGNRGARFPVLQLHSDCDGEWTTDECAMLLREVQTVRVELSRQPLRADLLTERMLCTASEATRRPDNLHQALLDVNGTPLADGLIGLCELALRVGRPILFQ